MMQQEKGHAQTSMIHSNLCKSRTLVKIAKGQAGHSILTSGPNLARGPGFEHPWSMTSYIGNSVLSYKFIIIH